MVAQVVAILLLILGQDHLRRFFVLGQVALWVVVVTAVVSASTTTARFNCGRPGRDAPIAGAVLVRPAATTARALARAFSVPAIRFFALAAGTRSCSNSLTRRSK